MQLGLLLTMYIKIVEWGVVPTLNTLKVKLETIDRELFTLYYGTEIICVYTLGFRYITYRQNSTELFNDTAKLMPRVLGTVFFIIAISINTTVGVEINLTMHCITGT